MVAELIADLIAAMGYEELRAFLWMSLLMDVPRYFIAMLVLAAIPMPGKGRASNDRAVSGLIACHNEAHTISACVAAMKANGISQIIVINDGSSDRTSEAASAAGASVIDLPRRIGKPLALAVGLPHCSGEALLVADADTVFAPGAVALALSHLEDGVGGVGFDLAVSNAEATLTTRFQAIEYLLAFTAGRRIADALGIMPNIAGAAGLFRRQAVLEVGGFDCEVADDAALAMHLRCHGWQLRHASGAQAMTAAPETPVPLFLQRLRWDASVITIWWRKFGFLLNPFSRRFSPRNLFTSLDVLVFSALLPLIWLFYLSWLGIKLGGEITLILLAATMLVLFALETVILLLLDLPLRRLPYVPHFILMQTLVMRPLRALAVAAELAFNITRYDDYIPREQRWRLT